MRKTCFAHFGENRTSCKVVNRKELPKQLHEKIKRLCAEGDEFVEQKEYEAALLKYRDAWELVPDPKIDWEASTWLLVSVGEVFFIQKNFEKALRSFLRAVQCPRGLGNPYIHLRLGQLHFELGDLPAANDNLTRAFMGAGEEIFAKEDKKYFKHLKTVIKMPKKT